MKHILRASLATAQRSMILAATLAMSVTGCRDSATAPAPSVSIDAIDEITLVLGATRTLLANGSGAGSLEWVSSDSTVARVDPRGLVTATGVGTARIRAQWGAAVDSTTIIVERLASGTRGWLAIYGGAGNNDFTCGLYSDRRIYCWGSSLFGASLGSVQPGGLSNVPVPITLPAGVSVREFRLGANTMHCLLDTAGAAHCWGQNTAGLGNPTINRSATPVRVVLPVNEPLVSVAPSYATACGLTAAGAVYCWGNNPAAGLLGVSRAELPESAVPIRYPLPEGLRFVRLDAFGQSMCGITAAGETWCWGANTVGELGTGNTEPVNAPTRSVIPSLRQVAGWPTRCGITMAYRIVCWGGGASGMLANGLKPPSQPLPSEVVVPGVSFKQVSMGNAHSCAVSIARELYCWGTNNFGTLEPRALVPDFAETVEQFLTPRKMTMPAGVVPDVVAAARGQLCVLTVDGRIFCWGAGAEGGLGNGGLANQLTPVQVRDPQ
ncbi:Ig-like domain-containing protein [Gemmatimonas sp.]|uniref:Ig-like domain-containing protein n=1 Tax=Gemmatimonas sp. TaxID=1962908 RepID=UPI003341BA59